MTQHDLRELGVSSFGDRKRFSSAMTKIRQEIYNEYISLMIELDLTLNTPLLEGAGDSGTVLKGGEGVRTESAECDFDDSEEFVQAFEASDHLAGFHKAMCSNCNYDEIQTSKRDCAGAKRAFRALSSRFHPDVVHRIFPGCGKALKTWAAAAMTNVAMSINDNCRGKRNRKEKGKMKMKRKKESKKSKPTKRKTTRQRRRSTDDL